MWARAQKDTEASSSAFVSCAPLPLPVRAAPGPGPSAPREHVSPPASAAGLERVRPPFTQTPGAGGTLLGALLVARARACSQFWSLSFLYSQL